MLWPRELSWKTSVRQSAVLVKTREGLVRDGADVQWVRGETGRFLWVKQQSKVVGCCPGVLSPSGCFVVTLVDMLAIAVANMQNGMWERQDGRWCESREWRLVDANDLISCDYTQPLSLWLLWRLIDLWPFQPLVNKCGKAVLPAQDW